MIEEVKNNLWSQFGASIEMLANAIQSCPEELYITNKRFFYTAYHALVFLDYYLTIPPQNFRSGLSFTFMEKENIPQDALDDVVPNEHYSKQQLLAYLKSCMEKCHVVIMGIQGNKANPRFVEDLESGAMDYSVVEILLYNMRHVQHHTAQLNMMLRQHGLEPPKWVARAT